MRRPLTLLLLAILPTACQVGPDFEAPKRPKTGDAFFNAKRKEVSKEEMDKQDEKLLVWWTQFHDSTLNERIHQALEKSMDMRSAVAKVKEAQALARAAGSSLWPTVNAKGSYTRQRESEHVLQTPASDSNLFRAGLEASWEIDIWGGNQRMIEAAEADAKNAELQASAVRVSLAAETAKQEILARGLAARLHAIRVNLEAQRETLQIATDRKESGLATEAPMAQAEAQLAGIEARIAPLKEALAGAENRLAVLMGEIPGTVHVASVERRDEAAEVPTAPEPPAGLPADVLRRRPDIAAAEFALHGATARMGVAEAELYPKFSLTGSFGTGATNSADLFKWSSRYFSVGPSVQWRLFDRRQIHAQMEVAGARAEGALADFDKTTLTALEEVENALVAMDTNASRLTALERAIHAAERSVSLSKQLYTDGLGDFLSVLIEQQRLFDAREQHADAKTQQALNLVTLYKVLGGGWIVDPENGTSWRIPKEQREKKAE